MANTAPLPDHKTIADFRKNNGLAIREVCTRFVALCRTLGLLTQASVAIDGSNFKVIRPFAAWLLNAKVNNYEWVTAHSRLLMTRQALQLFRTLKAAPG